MEKNAIGKMHKRRQGAIWKNNLRGGNDWIGNGSQGRLYFFLSKQGGDFRFINRNRYRVCGFIGIGARKSVGKGGGGKRMCGLTDRKTGFFFFSLLSFNFPLTVSFRRRGRRKSRKQQGKWFLKMKCKK